MPIIVFAFLSVLARFRQSFCAPSWRALGSEAAESREVIMLDMLYIAIVIAFFVLLWGFTKASERL